MSNMEDKYKQILADVVAVAMSHIQDVALQLKDLDVNDKNYKDKPADIVQKARILNNVLTLINDVLHPAHDIAKEMYPKAADVIDICIENQKLAIENKILSYTCNCSTCKAKGVNVSQDTAE